MDILKLYRSHVYVTYSNYIQILSNSINSNSNLLTNSVQLL